MKGTAGVFYSWTQVFAIIDSAIKTGVEHAGIVPPAVFSDPEGRDTTVLYCAYDDRMVFEGLGCVRQDIANAALAVELHDEMRRRGILSDDRRAELLSAFEFCDPINLPKWGAL